MATAKLATLLIRTIAKPISNQLKQQAKEHPTFRNICVSIAQRKYRAEVQLRTNLLGEPAKAIRPLSETKAIENGANTLAETFLFGVAAALILGESWRSSRNQAKRRDIVDDRIEELATKVDTVADSLDNLRRQLEDNLTEERRRNDELNRILGTKLNIDLAELLSTHGSPPNTILSEGSTT